MYVGYVTKIAVTACVCVASAVCLMCFARPALPCLFDGYSVLYVDKNVPQEDVEHYLREGGCTSFIDSSTIMHLPLTQDMLSSSPASGGALDSAATLIASLAVMNDEYLMRRSGYFTDDSGEYSLYYVPNDQPTSRAVKAMIEDMGSNFDGGVALEGSRGFPIRFVLVVFALAMFLCLVSKSVVWAIFPLLFVIRHPAPFSALSSALMLCALFDAHGIFFPVCRAHAFSVMIKRGIFPILATSSVLVGVIGGRGMGQRIVSSSASLICSLCVMRIQHLLGEAKKTRHYFNPVPILVLTSASSLVKGRHAVYLKTAIISGAIMTAVVFALSANTDVSSVKTTGKDIKIPSGLPSVEDYCAWCWQCLTFPYTRLGEEDGDKTVVFPTYKEEGGVIKEDIKEINAEDGFDTWCINKIDELPSGEVEHLIKSRVTYNSESILSPPSVGEGGALMIAIMSFIAFVSCFFLVSPINVRRPQLPHLESVRPC